MRGTMARERRETRSQWQDIRVGLPTAVLMAAVVGAGAFAAGRSMPAAPTPPDDVAIRAPDMVQAPRAAAELPTEGDQNPEPETLPPGHPAIGAMGQTPAVDEAPAGARPALEWKAPARWQLVPNASTMRIATYRIPRAPGDAADAELSITQAGGSAEANAQRWIGQFDQSGQKPARQTTRKVGSLDVLVVEVQGAFSGGMGADGKAQPGWALLGAIVSTPGLPHFFKLTGPVKTVLAARGEFDAMLATFRQREATGL
jgi:hypothetical protein